jgi:hypothetical protein
MESDEMLMINEGRSADIPSVMHAGTRFVVKNNGKQVLIKETLRFL